MIFRLTELEHHPVAFDLTFAPGEIPLGEDLKQSGLLSTSGQAELLRNTEGEIRLRGHVQVVVDAPCDRCLEPAALSLDTGFDLFFRPAPRVAGYPEMRLGEGEVDLSFYSGDGVQLEEALREFILLELPMQHTCRPDCLGICPQCGENRNVKPCACPSRPPDDRWAGLRSLE